MQYSRILSRVFTFVIICAFILCGCGEDKSTSSQPKDKPKTDVNKEAQETGSMDPAYGDAIIEGTIGDASNLIPALASDSSSSGIIDLVYSGLVKIDKDLNLVPDAAESWDISEDGLTITFHLRKNIKWHDGQPFTAKDVMFSYKTMIDPKTPTAYAEQFKQVKTARVIDDYTFEVTYGRPFARALLTWAFSIMPAHLLEGKDITTSELARHPVGTGPYIFKSWETGQRITLESNPDYFDGRPYISRTITRIIPDMATMFLELKSGGIDHMGLSPDQFKYQTNTPEFKENYKSYRYPSFGYVYLGFNLLDPKFKDVRVRKAVNYAINKEELVQGVLLGLGQVANGPYQPGHWAYNENVKPYPFDQARARELLAEAGWKDTDGDGVLDNQGAPFEFTIITNQGNKNREQTGLIIQQRLKEVGIVVKLRTIEWAAFLKEFIDKKNFEATILSWTIPIDPDLYNVWHSSKTAPGELNFISYSNKEVDELIDKGRFTFDQAVRKQAYDRIQEILMDEVPYIFLYVPDALPVVASRFHGIKPEPAGISYNFTKWYVPKHLQKYTINP